MVLSSADRGATRAVRDKLPSEEHELTDEHDSEMRSAFGAARVTPQRVRIARTAASMPGAFTVEELVRALGAAGEDAGTATVYRAVAALEDSGFLERVGERGSSALYLRCAAHAGHHHHLVCTGCGRVEIAECPIEPVLALAADRCGFTLTSHDVSLYGLCAACGTTSDGRG